MGGCCSKPPNAAKNVSAASQAASPKAESAATQGQYPPGAAGKKVIAKHPGILLLLACLNTRCTTVGPGTPVLFSCGTSPIFNNLLGTKTVLCTERWPGVEDLTVTGAHI